MFIIDYLSRKLKETFVLFAQQKPAAPAGVIYFLIDMHNQDVGEDFFWGIKGDANFLRASTNFKDGKAIVMFEGLPNGEQLKLLESYGAYNVTGEDELISSHFPHLLAPPCSTEKLPNDKRYPA